MTLRFLLIITSFVFYFGAAIAQEDGFSMNLKDDEVYVEIHLLNLNSTPLIREKVTVSCEKPAFQQEYLSNVRGVVKFVAKINTLYEVSFVHDQYYSTITTPARNGSQPVIKEIMYEGTEAAEQKLREKAAMEKRALERWGTVDAVGFKEDLDKYSSGNYNFEDETVLKVLKRNPQWKNKLIITDITGSMYPYIGQVLLWFELNYEGEKTTKLTFFNDGDAKADNEKVIGETGGIYYCEKCDTTGLQDVMIRAMAGGYGGDGPENDLEAVLKSVERIKDFKEVILIADNNSEVKDIALLDSIKVPVRIIVCGADERVSTEYLNIAYATKGSVHTIEQDLYDLKNMHDGMEIKIGKRTYRLRKGKFVLTDKK